MAGFTVLTGLVVLFGTIATSRYQRLQESVFLRTLGASGKWAQGVVAIEYTLLGVLAVCVGSGLALLASYALALLVFEVPYKVAWADGLVRNGGAVLLTVLIGWLGTRGVLRRSPLEVLRREG